jgi:hypothetical protein
MNRREMLASTGAVTLAALCMPKLMKADAPASRVAIVLTVSKRPWRKNERIGIQV